MAWPTEEELREIYAETQTIAVVGASGDENKPGHRIPRYLKSQGFKIIPVNPTADEVLGERAYPSLSDVDMPIDTVEVFRPAEEAPDIARQAVAMGAKHLWLQEGIVSEEAREVAEEGGVKVVMDMCMGATHGWLGLGPGP
ncbi:MAG: CoA-binding protein [Actinomycetota bacterium]